MSLKIYLLTLRLIYHIKRAAFLVRVILLVDFTAEAAKNTFVKSA